MRVSYALDGHDGCIAHAVAFITCPCPVGWRPRRGTEPAARSYTRRWVIDTVAGTVDEQIVDDLPVEFPTLNERYLGAENRYQYAVSFLDGQGYGDYGVVKYDRTTGARSIHRAGDARLPSEAVFVPAEGATRTRLGPHWWSASWSPTLNTRRSRGCLATISSSTAGGSGSMSRLPTWSSARAPGGD
ncbi:carotenoid oxygenase family protein [Streptomyces echinatus]|uniref:carotenoid oxygenase family protein n=1 Tax=Streptomyces echinatus TaxID=67293 RepID=UPI00380AD17A